jgi:flagellar biosynthetic protein FlhB
MAEQDSGQERTEQPTPKRLEDARKNGQILRAREFNTLVMMLAASLTVYLFGDRIAQSCLALLRDLLELERDVVFDRGLAINQAFVAAERFLLAQVPLFVIMGLAVFCGPAMVGGIRLSAEALAIKPDRVDPLKGLQRMFSLNALLELGKSMLKVSWLCVVVWLVSMQYFDQVIGLGRNVAEQGIERAAGLLMLAMLLLSVALVPIAMLDVPHQIWEHLKKLRMTRQEVRDEMKETEGSPELRARIRQQQREVAQRRMMDEVPHADVVITNPTHFAVALRYDPGAQGAPKVVAKGRGHVAARIRELAVENGVPLFSAPPLARALYRSTELQQHIPAGLYLAVARVLAYVYQLRRSAGSYDVPPLPADLPIPDEFLKRDRT